MSELHPIDRAVGANVRAFREGRGLSLDKLADAAAMTTDQLKAVEAGARRLRAVELYHIAKELCVEASRLFAGLTPDDPAPVSCGSGSGTPKS